MTIDPSKLLQMLEPAVRPGMAPASAGQHVGKPAFEDRSFEDLLQEVGQTRTGSAETDAKTSQESNLLGVLSGWARIENAALRSVLAQARGAGEGSGGTR